MGLPYISVACGRTDLRRVKLLAPDREPITHSPFERRFKGKVFFFSFCSLRALLLKGHVLENAIVAFSRILICNSACCCATKGCSDMGGCK